MNIDAYLQHIGISDVKAPTLDFLRELQLAHMMRVPFENLSVRDGEVIELTHAWLYEKIIGRKRGGFCYELNGLFSWLLVELGYDVTLIEAGVYNSNRAAFGHPFDHLALVVRLDGVDWLTDVGFGDSSRTPFRFPTGEADNFDGHYRLTPLEATHEFRMQKLMDGVWVEQYELRKIGRMLSDFNEMCVYQRTSPESGFRKRTICTRALPDGRITLTENSFTTKRTGVSEKIAIRSREHQAQLLEKWFGITL